MSNVKKEILEWVVTIVAGVAIAILINTFGGLAIVEGSSMYSTLHDKDILLRAAYHSKTPQRGDIIAFKTDLEHPWAIYQKFGIKKNLIKRVIGIEGDNIVITNGQVFRNGEKLVEPYIHDAITQGPEGDINIVVPPGKLFVMGDNRVNSHDSRWSDIGPVDVKSVIGKTSFRLFPFSRFGKIDN